LPQNPEYTILFLQVLAALGTPGVTFYVMKKMTASFTEHVQARCRECKAELDRRIKDQEDKDRALEERQLALRTNILPNLATREDVREVGREIKASFERAQSDLKEDIRRVHGRINGFHNNQGGK